LYQSSSYQAIWRTHREFSGTELTKAKSEYKHTAAQNFILVSKENELQKSDGILMAKGRRLKDQDPRGQERGSTT
jgi:hypothetical protein